MNLIDFTVFSHLKWRLCDLIYLLGNWFYLSHFSQLRTAVLHLRNEKQMIKRANKLQKRIFFVYTVQSQTLLVQLFLLYFNILFYGYLIMISKLCRERIRKQFNASQQAHAYYFKEKKHHCSCMKMTQACL